MLMINSLLESMKYFERRPELIELSWTGWELVAAEAGKLLPSPVSPAQLDSNQLLGVLRQPWRRTDTIHSLVFAAVNTRPA